MLSQEPSCIGRLGLRSRVGAIWGLHCRLVAGFAPDPRSLRSVVSFKGKLSNGLLIGHVVILGELQQQISWSMDVAPL